MVEFLDFGKLCAMIKNSKRSIQNKICKDLMTFIHENIGDLNEHFTPEIMISFIENIHELRNVCAHNNRLLDFRCKADSKYLVLYIQSIILRTTIVEDMPIQSL